jgi:hypothetical protein
MKVFVVSRGRKLNLISKITIFFEITIGYPFELDKEPINVVGKYYW